VRRGMERTKCTTHLAAYRFQRLAIWQMQRPWTPRTVAPEAGDGSLSPLISHPAFLTTGRAVSSSHLARPLLCVPVLWGRHPPSIRYGLRLLGIFARVPTQELSPRRWLGGATFLRMPRLGDRSQLPLEAFDVRL
jgi:hypothetical protein